MTRARPAPGAARYHVSPSVTSSSPLQVQYATGYGNAVSGSADQATGGGLM